MGRMNLALKFNEMVRNGEIGPVILAVTITIPVGN